MKIVVLSFKIMFFFSEIFFPAENFLVGRTLGRRTGGRADGRADGRTDGRAGGRTDGLLVCLFVWLVLFVFDLFVCFTGAARNLIFVDELTD